jgi:hypothetical protein
MEPGVTTMVGEVAVVTFYSDWTVQGQGFFMLYEAISNSTSNSTNISRDLILSDYPTANLVHPAEGFYHNNELSVFIYSPNYYYEETSTIKAEYFLNGFENGCECCDSAYVYTFTEGRDASWQDQGL